MIDAKYIYFVGNVIFLMIWLVFFAKRKDLREEMLFLGIIFAIMGPLAQGLWYTKDWWNPVTITGTSVGIEDVMLGFTNAGIASVLFETVFNRKYSRKIKISMKAITKALPRMIVLSLILVIPIFIGFYLFKTHSFIANISGFLLATGYILVNRPNLLKDSVITAALMPFVALPVFIVIYILDSNYIELVWQLRNLSGVIILGAPLEDLIWYSAVGLFIGGLFEFVFDYKLKEQKVIPRK